MNQLTVFDLFHRIIDGQVDDGTSPGVPPDRLREACTSGPELSEREKKLLVLSPVSRMDYLEIMDQVRTEIGDMLREEEIATELLPLAAATDADRLVLKGAGFEVSLYRQGDGEPVTVILVQLGAGYQRAIHPLTVLRLADSGGLEWLRGRFDRNGELTGVWSDREVDLFDRVRRHSLLLEPV